MPRYTGNPKTVIDGAEFFYDDTGETGPELLGGVLGNLRQAESDANWPGAPAMIAKANDAAARVELADIDRRSIRALREDDTVRIAALEAEAVAARLKLRRPPRPGPVHP